MYWNLWSTGKSKRATVINSNIGCIETSQKKGDDQMYNRLIVI